jgi:nucleotidyltransferase substrate binding protein (TIGR01987 family)
MDNNQDIRWKQRFSNYKKALEKLKESISYIKQDLNKNKGKQKSEQEIILSEIIKEGLIQRFEYTHELAWNVMKDYAEFQGNSNIGGSRDATREAFSLKLISKGDVWMDMIKSRNKTSHTYNEETANEIYHKILDEYYPVFSNFEEVMDKKSN